MWPGSMNAGTATVTNRGRPRVENSGDAPLVPASDFTIARPSSVGPTRGRRFEAGKTVDEAREKPCDIAALDGIRKLAILAVLGTHVPDSTLEHLISSGGSVVRTLAHFGGYFGVDLFFVLSGFLITRILLRSAGTPASRPNFWI